MTAVLRDAYGLAVSTSSRAAVDAHDRNDAIAGPSRRTRRSPAWWVPLMEGLHAFAGGDYAAAVTRIEPVEGRIVEVGGSHAQRPNPGHFWEKVRAS